MTRNQIIGVVLLLLVGAAAIFYAMSNNEIAPTPVATAPATPPSAVVGERARGPSDVDALVKDVSREAAAEAEAKPQRVAGDAPAPVAGKDIETPKLIPEITQPDPASATLPKVAADAAGDKQIAALPSTQVVQPEPEIRPEFDVVEVDRDGAMVVAGRAMPGAQVVLKSIDGAVLAEAVADDSGAFTMLPPGNLPDGDSAVYLSVRSSEGDGLESENTVIVHREGRAPALVVLQPNDAEKPSRVLQEPPAPKREATMTAGGEAPPPDAAPNASEGEAAKLQDKSLAVGAIDYDEKGKLALRGTAPPGASVTVDVDGKPVAAAKADADGAWSATTEPGVADGAARIGATAMESGGDGEKGVLRISLPFAPASLIQEFPQGRMVIVQPGNSLWRIARRTYGAGLRYTVIYAANRGQIHNPDRIYPGQILHAPKPGAG